VQRILRPYTGAGITITESRARGSQDCGLYIIADYRNLRLACRLAGATKLSARLSRDFRGASRAVGGRSARIGVDPFLNVDSRAASERASVLTFRRVIRAYSAAVIKSRE